MAKIIRVEKCSDCNFNTVLYEDYYKTSGNTYCLKASRDIYIEDIPSWCPLEDAPDPHEIWAAAQLNARKEKIFGLLTEFRYKDTGEEK